MRRPNIRQQLPHPRPQRVDTTLALDLCALGHAPHLVGRRHIQLISLAEDDLVADAGEPQTRQDAAVLVLDAVLSVEEDKDTPQRLARLDVLHDLDAPGGQRAGAVARHVDYDQAAAAGDCLATPVAAGVQRRRGDAHAGLRADAVEIHRLGEARGAARAGEEPRRVAAHDGVEERRLAHVGAPDEGDFWDVGLGEHAELGDAAQEGGMLAVVVEEAVGVRFVRGRGRQRLKVPVVVVGAGRGRVGGRPRLGSRGR